MTSMTVPFQPRLSRRSNGRRPIWALVALLAAATAPTLLSALEPELSLSDGSREIDRHEIGNDLVVTLEGVRPLADYRLTLLDETRGKVVEVIRTADDSGRVGPGPRPLWERTGILGCDPDAPIDPSGYRYQDLDQADALLGGRTFSLEARELGSSQAVSSLQLPITAERSRPVFFFTDAAACPRDEIREGESLYLYARGLIGGSRQVVVVLVDGSKPPAVGEDLIDVRAAGSGPQGIELEPGEESFFELVWSSAEVGIYGAVTRLSRDLTLVYRAEDRWVGRYGSAIPDPSDMAAEDSDISPHGITVVPWDER